MCVLWTNKRVNVTDCVDSQFKDLYTCIQPYLGWAKCKSDSDDGRRESPLASAARRFAVSRRLRDWSLLVDLLNAECADSRPPGSRRIDNVVNLCSFSSERLNIAGFAEG